VEHSKFVGHVTVNEEEYQNLSLSWSIIIHH